MLHLLAAVTLAAPSATISVCVDPGHGGSDPGAVANDLEEADVNLATALALRDWLELDTRDTAGGGAWDVIMTREDDGYVSLSGRTQIANAAGVDYFLSIHANAGGGDGTETYAYKAGTTSDGMAHLVQEELVDMLGTRDRGVKYAEFYVITYTSMPATLTELAFLDTWSGNAELLSDPAVLDDAGLAHLYALQRQVGVAPYTPTDVVDPDEPFADVALASRPDAVEAGANLEVQLRWRTNLPALSGDAELGLRMVDAEDWEVLGVQTWSTGDTQGRHTFTLTAPDQQGEVFFTAWAGPAGGGWAGRLDEASSAGAPTAITADDPHAEWISVADYPGEVVRGGHFGVRIDHDLGWDGDLTVQLVEARSGRVDHTVVVPLSERGRQEVELSYEGEEDALWILACAGDMRQPCQVRDDSEEDPIAVLDRQEPAGKPSRGCAHGPMGGWILPFLALAWTRRRARVDLQRAKGRVRAPTEPVHRREPRR